MTTSEKAEREPIVVDQALINAARLRVTLNNRRGLPTSKAIRELAERTHPDVY